MTTRAKTTKPSLNAKLSPAANRPHTHFPFLWRALREAVRDLNPGQQKGQPAIFTISVVNLVTTGLFLGSLLAGTYTVAFISGMTTAWLWITLLWLNFARTLAKKHLYARTEALCRLSGPATVKRLGRTGLVGDVELVPTVTLNREDVILVEHGDIIPADGEVIGGIAAVDERLLTGSREPVIRMVDDTLNAVSGGTQVRSGQLIISLKAKPGDGLPGRICGLAQVKKDGYQPSNFLLNTLTAGSVGLTLVVALWLSIASRNLSTGPVALSLLTALLAALAPSLTAGLLSLANSAGTDQLIRLNFVPLRDNVLSRLEQITVLLLDKNAVLIPNTQQAVEFVPAGSRGNAALYDTSRLAHFFDLATENGTICQYSPTIRSSRPSTGVLTDLHVTHSLLSHDSRQGDMVHLQLHQGGPEAVITFLRGHGIEVPSNLMKIMKNVINRGGQPLVITQSDAVMGVLHVQQQLRKGLKGRVETLRQLGIHTILVGKDAPATTAALAAAIGADDFLASATGASIQALVKQHHTAGQQTMLAGCPQLDATAICESGIGVAFNRSAYPVREAADIIDLDSSPVKILDLIEAGRQRQMTRRALTVMGGTSDLVKFLVIGLLVLGIILPAPNFTSSATVSTAAIDIVLAGLVFNAVGLIVLTPLALGGLPFRLMTSARSQRSIVVACVICGLLAPLIGMTLLPLVIAALSAG